MELSDLRDTIKLQLTGGILESDIPDETYDKIIDMAMREMNKYYNSTELMEVAGNACIDLSNYPSVGTVMNVYSGSVQTNSSSNSISSGSTDPWYNSQLQMYNVYSSYYNPNRAFYNVAAYNLAKQLANTISGADLEFKQDKKGQKLYINFSQGTPATVTIEYIPILRDVSEIVSDYWLDILQRLALAHTKIALGRIRTRFTQEGAQWTQDGETILEEGKTELTNLRESLRKNNDLQLPLD